jgi:hypothetical protein
MKRVTAICLAAAGLLTSGIAMKAQDAKLRDFKAVYEKELRDSGIVGSSL